MIKTIFNTISNIVSINKLNKKGDINYLIYGILALVALVVILFLFMNWNDLAGKFLNRVDTLGGHKYD